MDEYTIIACRICNKLMRRYSMEVYPGDSSCCRDCNAKADSNYGLIKWLSSRRGEG